MSPETEALARRAVACAAWRWMPGMWSADYHGAAEEHRHIRVRDSIDADHLLGAGALPDLTDPATLGCLLTLVREAWSDPGISTCHMDGYDSYDWVCAVDTDRLAPGRAFPATRNGVTWFNGPTEAAALVAALEAAPVRR